MSFLCKILGHTWVPVTVAPAQSWHTTKDGHTLVQSNIEGGPVMHLERCVRCGIVRNVGQRRHDADHEPVEQPDAEAPKA